MSTSNAPDGDPRGHWVQHYLRTAPEAWAEIDRDRLTETQEQALRAMIGAGLVRMRTTVRLRLAGHPDRAEAVVSYTGVKGLEKANTEVAAQMWPRWKEAHSRLKADTPGEPLFHCEETGQVQWRLTDLGETARRGIDGRSGRPSGWEAGHEPLPGDGRLERFKVLTDGATSPAVNDPAPTDTPMAPPDPANPQAWCTWGGAMRGVLRWMAADNVYSVWRAADGRTFLLDPGQWNVVQHMADVVDAGGKNEFIEADLKAAYGKPVGHIKSVFRRSEKAKSKRRATNPAWGGLIQPAPAGAPAGGKKKPFKLITWKPGTK